MFTKAIYLAICIGETAVEVFWEELPSLIASIAARGVSRGTRSVLRSHGLIKPSEFVKTYHNKGLRK